MQSILKKFATVVVFTALALSPALAADTDPAAELRSRANSGDAFSQFLMGVMYQQGQGVEASDEQAVQWFTKAAENGLAVAQWTLGGLYSLANPDGPMKMKDNEEAVKWYRKAADQGFAAAQCDLGEMYAKGFGVERSDAQAVVWYRKAAVQGSAQAQYLLGVCRSLGRGIKEDKTDSLFWFHKASDQGHGAAQAMLGYSYMKGIGTEKDKNEAYVYFSLAMQNSREETVQQQAQQGLAQLKKDFSFSAAEQAKNDARMRLLYDQQHARGATLPQP